MWTLVALFCNLAEPSKGYCEPATPPMIFQTYEDCMEFGTSETTGVPLDKVSYDFQCVAWNNKT